MVSRQAHRDESDMNQHILIIDDEPQIRELLARAFEAHGCTTSQAGTEREARRAIAETKPGLIITDLQLAEGDGLQVVDALKQLLPEVPVILLTGVLLDEEVAGAMTQGRIAAYLQKTEPLQAIVAKARHLLASNGGR